MTQVTSYANVDLVLKAPEDLSSLVAQFCDNVMVLSAGSPTASNEAILEVHHNGGPEGAINTFCDLVDSLPGEARAIWTRCTERTLDVGFNAGLEPWPYQSSIGAKTLERVARIGAKLMITIYPYRTKGG